MTHFATSYIGLPWVAGGQGPDEFDCWGLVRFIEEHHYGLDIPAVNISPDNLRAVITEFTSNPIFKDFSEVKTPKDGDIVLMRQAKYPVHAGIWLDVDGGGVLHCVREGGVIFQNQISLNLAGWFIDGFYRAIK